MERASIAADWMLRTFLDALQRSTVDCRELSGTNWAGRSPLLGSIVRCRPKSLVDAHQPDLFRPMFRQAKPLAYFITDIVPVVIAQVLNMSTRTIETGCIANTELSIRRLLKIQKNISAHHVLGISDLAVHPNTHYNAATMAFEYDNASSAETPPLLLPPRSGK
jgi:hypothetical protein